MTGSDTAIRTARFRAVLAERLGWAFADVDAPQLARVLDRRAARLDLNPADYLQQLHDGGLPKEVSELTQDLGITETYFFRHAEQFRALADVALPARLRCRADERVLRLLSVGCSSGEEAYTLAITAREAQPDPAWQITVLGLDANPAVLRRASTARYSTWALRETPDAVRRRWFRPHDDTFEVDPHLRTMVRFRQYNVVDDDALWHIGHYDAVFCRNLLMYLTPSAAGVLVERMTRALAPGGVLFLGHTDSLGSSPAGLERQHSHNTFYYRRSVAPVPPAGGPPAVPRPAAERTASSGPRPRGPDGVPPAPGVARTPVVPAVPNPRQRALNLLRDEQFAAALAVVEAAMPTEPQPPEVLLQGVLLALTGRLDSAEVVARRLLHGDGLYADGHHLLGVCVEDDAVVEEAVGHYRMAAHLDWTFAMPRLRLGLLARRRGDHRAAAEQLESALSLLPQEREERIALFGGGFGRLSLVGLCRAELDACGVHR